MSTTTHEAAVQAPVTVGERLKLVGPGLIAAATGVGAGDIVASIVAGTEYALTFIWAAVLGSILKYFLAEGVGRWHLASGTTILRGWQSLGRWATGYFAVYVVVWGFVFGAAASSSTALSLRALFPSIPFNAWAVISALTGLALVVFGRYNLFEKVMMALIGVMFVTVVGTAVMLLPNLGRVAAGFAPTLPSGSLLYVVGLIGGVGGTITLASYGYWLREKGWRSPRLLPLMHTDNAVAYISTAIFSVSLIIIGAELLFSGGLAVEGEEGLITVANVLENRFGAVTRLLFLLGFWSAAYTSLLGVWSGVSYLFADFVRVQRGIPDEEADPHVNEKSPAFRAYVAWLTFPPLILVFLGEPVTVVIVYAALGALFMPFLAATLLRLLNSSRVDRDYRNRLRHNIVLGFCIGVFIVVGAQELLDAI